ncbi:MAG: hypothetical protein U1E21_10160 [Reyranellaceae bacterium]
MHALIEWLKPLFAAPEAPVRQPLKIAQFGLGVCPGCRGLRGVASPRCEACGNAAPVTEDA